jgi:hypothetical protein
MISSCTNEQAAGYSEYGGRGIRVCEVWLNSFQSFLGDAGECPGVDYTLKLKNFDGHFEPGNVQWVIRNGGRITRTNDSLHDEHMRQCLQQLANDAGVDAQTFACRFISDLTEFHFASY